MSLRTVEWVSCRMCAFANAGWLLSDFCGKSTICLQNQAKAQTTTFSSIGITLSESVFVTRYTTGKMIFLTNLYENAFKTK